MKNLKRIVGVVLILSLICGILSISNVKALNYYSYISLYDVETGAGQIGILFYGSGNVNNNALEGISYDKTTNTLTLKNVNTEYGIGYNEMGDNFTINIEGENSIGGILGYTGAFTLSGKGTLTINQNSLSQNAIKILAEGAMNSALTINKNVNVNLYAKDNVISIVGTKIDSKENAIKLRNGQEINIEKEQFSYTNGKVISAVYPSEYESSYTKCIKGNEIWGKGRSITMAIQDENGNNIKDEEGNDVYKPGSYLTKMIYDEGTNIYLADETIDRVWVLEEEFENSGYIMQDETIKTYYTEMPSDYNYLYVDDNGNEYVCRSYYYNGEQRLYVYDISENKVTYSDGKSYYLLMLNDKVDGTTLRELEEVTIVEGQYNYTVKGKYLKIEANENIVEEPIIVPQEDEQTNNEAVEEVTKLVNDIIKGEEIEGIDEELAEEIKDAVDNGKTITVEVTTPEVLENQVSQDDAKKIEEKTGEDTKIAAYYDIDVVVKIDGNEKGNVTELNNKITIALPIPENLPQVKEGYTRKFIIIRIHNGVAEELETTVNGKNVSFESDKFSTYALTYKDESDNKYALGDVNKDGKVNSLDATLILKYVAKKKTLDVEQLKLADVTKDGKVNSLDAVKILKYVAKKITSF